MKILIITQKIDRSDGVLGFMHRWILEFSRQCEKVVGVCLYEGKHNLPENVLVRSLGKEKKVSRIKYLFNFYRHIWRERNNYDAVFVHMNQVYVILGWPIWKLLGKKVGLWYAHGSVSLSLRVAALLADKIFTSTPSGFRLKSKKLNIVGQGIDTEKFKPESPKDFTGKLKMIMVGRISPVKDLKTLILALEILDKKKNNFEMKVIGGAEMPNDRKYFEKIKRLAREKGVKDKIEFLGMVSNDNLVPHLLGSQLFLNPSKTGSLDKAMLEGMACGLPVFTCNESIKTVFREDPKLLSLFYFEKENYEQMAQKIMFFGSLTDSDKINLSDTMRDIVVKEHSVAGLISKILAKYE